MHLRDSYCSYCGTPFPGECHWPRRCPACGNTTYRNPLPVAVLLQPAGNGIVVIRRNTEPRKGTLTLPGGYVDHGETWEHAARREFIEETGIDISDGGITLYDVGNGLDNTLVIIGLASWQPLGIVKPFRSEETQEVTVIRGPQELGFPLHTEVVQRFFGERDKRTRDIAT